MTDVQILQSAPKAMQDKIGDINSPGLKRNVLTPDGKRWQLFAVGIRGASAEAIIVELYGWQQDA